MDDVVAASIDDARFVMLVLTGFAVASLALAGVGLHGTLAYLTSQRTREFGVRLALGASRGGILGLVVREGGLLAGAGHGGGVGRCGRHGPGAARAPIRSHAAGRADCGGRLGPGRDRGGGRRRRAGLAGGANRPNDGAASRSLAAHHSAGRLQDDGLGVRLAHLARERANLRGGAGRQARFREIEGALRLGVWLNVTLVAVQPAGRRRVRRARSTAVRSCSDHSNCRKTERLSTVISAPKTMPGVARAEASTARTRTSL